ncbi:MAG TPA: lysophospholipid acyltransferase family protein [Pseudomonadales bacterium]
MASLKAALVRAAIGASGALSLENQRRIGRRLGRLAWRLDLEPARITRINLAACFPELAERDRRALARASLEHTGMLATELGAVFRWPRERWEALVVSVRGEELIEGAQAAGRGVLILIPHFGNWEFLALALGRYRPTALYDPPRIPGLERPLRAARDRAGAKLLPIGAGGLRGFYRALAAGEMVALLPDQVPERHAGVYADFFGRPALTMTFVHRLLQRADPVVLLGSAMRCPGGFAVGYTDLGRALHGPDPAASARAMNRAIEALVRRDPAQYQWEYKRFKRPPPGTPDPYRRA